MVKKMILQNPFLVDPETVGFWETFMSMKDWFMGLDLIFQILTIAVLTAITVGVLVLVFYILKGVFYLIGQMFKLMIEVIKAIFGVGKKKPVQQISAGTNTQVPQQNQPTTMVQSQTSIPTSTALFCPSCGQAFTQAMIELKAKNPKLFCEFCGALIEFHN